MITGTLLILPWLAGLLAFALRPAGLRRALLVGTALAHLGLTGSLWCRRPSVGGTGWFGPDGPGLLFLGITSGLFLAASVYALGYLAREARVTHRDFEEGFLFRNEPESVFVGCLLCFLGAMTLVCLSRDLGLLWVAVEATTLASAPLICFHRHHRSLEATWKYLLVCSVGIALALLGNFFLGMAAARAGSNGQPVPLLLDALLVAAPGLQMPWLKAAFILLLIGYGTKMGLAPMHTWLPDAHSESPSVVSALLSGAVLNCAFLAILRAYQVCAAAGQGEFARELLILFGLLSMGVAAVFILGQTDYKRLLAYSSVEHMGILALGIGLGGAGALGSAWHAINHSLTKAALFLAAGNILTVYQTKSIHDVRGVSHALPWTGALWTAGLLAITGTPPFGSFHSELLILKAALDGHQGWIAALYLALLGLIFVGMATAFLRMAQGRTPGGLEVQRLQYLGLAQVPPAVLLLLVLALGVHLPEGLRLWLQEVAHAWGGS